LLSLSIQQVKHHAAKRWNFIFHLSHKNCDEQAHSYTSWRRNLQNLPKFTAHISPLRITYLSAKVPDSGKHVPKSEISVTLLSNFNTQIKFSCYKLV
jgi:hypothetical protein